METVTKVARLILRILAWTSGTMVVALVLVVALIFFATPPPVSKEAQRECESVPGQVYHTGGRNAGICFPNKETERRAETSW